MQRSVILRFIFVDLTILAVQQGYCYTRVVNGRCQGRISERMSLRDCCCSRDVGKGWSLNEQTCQPCPFSGSGKYISNIVSCRDNTFIIMADESLIYKDDTTIMADNDTSWLASQAGKLLSSMVPGKKKSCIFYFSQTRWTVIDASLGGKLVQKLIR